MRIEEFIDFLHQFNPKADLKIVMSNGTPINVDKSNFGWSSGGDSDNENKIDAVEVCILLNDNEKKNN